jgi:hypothetical protein
VGDVEITTNPLLQQGYDSENADTKTAIIKLLM